MSEFAASASGTSRWMEAWPDALAFAGGLAVAWFLGWDTTDLVWSLWLSSLVVGYAMIVWFIFGPAILHRREGQTGASVVGVLGGLFMLAFFTVHFGMFHLVHSVFLNVFFPVGPKSAGLLNPELYGEVVSRCWYFVPLAVLAERHAFRLQTAELGATEDGSSRTRRSVRSARAGNMMAPYKNVIRLHLLIFFFAAAHYAKLDGFFVYTVVYAVYFFPWRLLGEPSAVTS